MKNYEPSVAWDMIKHGPQTKRERIAFNLGYTFAMFGFTVGALIVWIMA